MLACHVQKQGSLLTKKMQPNNLDLVKIQFSTLKKQIGTTTDAGFAAPLVQQDTYKGDFLELLRNATIFDKLSGFRTVPFNVKINGQTSVVQHLGWVRVQKNH